ncbi:MAG: outer membrane protein transport protein, partial [Gammaproteobacteria bacterium]|nr:outer membrane protein transport protein [Gammaproteobacteria bacterium]
SLNPETTIAFDINRTYWSAYETLDVVFHNGAGTSVNPRNYKDSNIYRIGVQHQMNDDFILRAGMYLDKTPVSDGYYTPETARNDALAYTAGATFEMSDNMELDLSLLIITFDEFDGPYDPQNFDGSYKTSATSIGAGFNYKF